MVNGKAKLNSLQAECEQGVKLENPQPFEITLSIDDFINEVEKGLIAANQGRLLDHHELKAKWEAKLLSK